MSRAVVVVGGPEEGPGQCATPSAVGRPPEQRHLLPWLLDLFDAWSSEAEEAQQQMDQLTREWRAGLTSQERFDTGLYYWRGRRDGFESAAFELRYRR